MIERLAVILATFGQNEPKEYGIRSNLFALQNRPESSINFEETKA